MNGHYLRVTADELAQALTDPEWALELAEGAQDEEEEADPPPAKARHLTTHKAWHAIAYLLERANFPVDVVYGEERLAGDEDLGYGPPHYLTAERVHAAAEALAAVSFDALQSGVTSAMLALFLAGNSGGQFQHQMLAFVGD